MKPSPARHTDLVTFIVITLVIGAACTLAINAYLTRDHHWAQIVSPQDEKAVDILAVNRLLRVYVRTDRNNLYLCGGRTWRDACQPVTEPDLPVTPVPGRWQTCTGTFPEPPPLDGRVVDYLQMGQCFEGKTYATIAVLEDGTMWQWQRTYSWVNTFALLSGTAASFSLAALAAWAIVRTLRYLREPVADAAPKGRMQ